MVVVRAGVQPEEAWLLSPAEAFALIEAYNDAENAKHKVFLTMQRFIASLIHNSNVKKGQQKTPEQLIPFDWDEKPSAAPEELSDLDRFIKEHTFKRMSAAKKNLN